MLVLDSTVLIAAMDKARSSHLAARDILSSDVEKAVTTQTMRETLAVATRPVAANGLGIVFADAWRSITTMRMACDRLLHESEKWWAAYAALANDIQPTGRTIYDLGQVAHVRSLGASAKLITDDDGLCTRYRGHIDVVTVADYSKPAGAP